jgi:hypothetical protein
MNPWAKVGIAALINAGLWCAALYTVGIFNDAHMGSAVLIGTMSVCVPLLFVSLTCGWLWQRFRGRKNGGWGEAIGLTGVVFIGICVLVGRLAFGGWSWVGGSALPIFPAIFGGIPLGYLVLCRKGSSGIEVGHSPPSNTSGGP